MTSRSSKEFREWLEAQEPVPFKTIASETVRWIWQYGELNPFYGKRHTAESKARISAKMRKRAATEEYKAYMSALKKGNKYFLGKHHSDEAKAKMSFSKIGMFVGNKFWNNGESEISIKGSPLDDNFVPGRLKRRLQCQKHGDVGRNKEGKCWECMRERDRLRYRLSQKHDFLEAMDF